MSSDPLGEEYRSISPYVYCAGNPVDFVDPDGMDYYMFDSNGKYQEKIQAEGTHRILIHSTGTLESGEEYDQYTFVDFADPESDPEAIDSGEIDQLVFVSEEEISSVLDVFVESDLLWKVFIMVVPVVQNMTIIQHMCLQNMRIVRQNYLGTVVKRIKLYSELIANVI